MRLLDTEIRIMNSDINRIRHEVRVQEERIKDNKDKIKLNRQLPYLVANVVELVEPDEDGEQDESARDVDYMRETKGCVVRTTSRQTMFLPIPGLIPVFIRELIERDGRLMRYVKDG